MWWNRESRLASVILLAIGLSIAAASIVYFGTRSDVNSLMHAVFVMLLGGFVCGAIVAYFCGGKVGQWFGDAIYFKSARLERAPDRLDRIKGLVEAARYDEAGAGLHRILARDALDIEARMLLIRINMESLHDEGAAIAISREFFDHPAHPSNRDSVDMLLLLSDILPPPEAAAYLRRELKRGRYSNYDRKLIQNRLESLSRRSP